MSLSGGLEMRPDMVMVMLEFSPVDLPVEGTSGAFAIRLESLGLAGSLLAGSGVGWEKLTHVTGVTDAFSQLSEEYVVVSMAFVTTFDEVTAWGNLGFDYPGCRWRVFYLGSDLGTQWLSDNKLRRAFGCAVLVQFGLLSRFARSQPLRPGVCTVCSCKEGTSVFFTTLSAMPGN